MPQDPVEALQALDARISSTDDANERTMLEHVKTRTLGEMIGDVDQIVSVMSPSFVLHLHHSLMGQEQTLTVDDIRNMAGSAPELDVCVNWVSWNHILLGPECLAINGTMKAQMPGVMAQAIYGADKVTDPTATYLVSTPVATFGDYEQGLMVKEESFIDGLSAVIEKVEDGSTLSRQSILTRL
jgi:hypothetical protein